jgi:hypothetical protein
MRPKKRDETQETNENKRKNEKKKQIEIEFSRHFFG